MPFKTDILSRFSGEVDGDPFYVPDLTLWYDTHRKKGTLPDRWQNFSLPKIARDLGVPVWLVSRPWKIETPGVEIDKTETEGERITRIDTSVGALTARWSLGPDGTWWQMEYPVKTPEDLDAALEFAQSYSYILDASDVTDCESCKGSTSLTSLEEQIGDDGILAIEIPTRPYAQLLYDLLGMSEGLMLLMDPSPVLREIIAVLEGKLQDFVRELASLPADLFFSPDNLDGQFISPPAFQEFLTDSYRRTTERLHQHGKYLMVHAGGPIASLLALLAEAGVDGVEGIAGPPQADASLVQAREITASDFTLWGGIPQDFLLATRDRQEFASAVARAVEEAQGDGRAILGVADRIPVDAELSRLEELPSLIE